jgi:hypothetical protein
MNHTLSDGTEIEYRVLPPADTAAAVRATRHDTRTFFNVIRLAVVNPESVLARLAVLPDPVGQATLLVAEILLASLRAQVHHRPSCRRHSTPLDEDGVNQLPHRRYWTRGRKRKAR